jgi:hypothetical protein
MKKKQATLIFMERSTALKLIAKTNTICLPFNPQ